MTQSFKLRSTGRWGAIAARSAGVVLLTTIFVACSSNQKITANSKRPVTLPPTIKAVKPSEVSPGTAAQISAAVTPTATGERPVTRGSPEQNVPAESVSFDGKETKYDYKNDPEKSSAVGDTRSATGAGSTSSSATGGGGAGGGAGPKPNTTSNADKGPSTGAGAAGAGAGGAGTAGAGTGGAGAGGTGAAGAGGAGGAQNKPQVAVAPDSSAGGAGGGAGAGAGAAGGPNVGGAGGVDPNAALGDKDDPERRGRVETASNKVLIEQDERLQTLDGQLPMALNMDEQGQFDFDRYLLRDEVRGKLDDLADKLKNAPYDKLHILGFTDRIGTPEYNQRLSEKRAWAVAGYLMEKGVPPYKLRVEGRGRDGALTNPEDCKGMAKEQMIDCLQRDRRVEILATVKEYNLKVQ